MKNNILKVCIITLPIRKSGLKPLSDLANICCDISEDVYLITGNDFNEDRVSDGRMHIIKLNYKYELNFHKIFRYIAIQLKISLHVLRLAKNVDIFVFFLGAGGFVLPLLISKVLGKKVVLLLPGSSTAFKKADISRYTRLLTILEKINRILSDMIIVYSRCLIREWGLEKYKNKVSIAHRHFVDLSKFRPQKQLVIRNTLIGYIGRFDEKKGVLNFVRSIPKILKMKSDIKFLVSGWSQAGGESRVCDIIEKYLEEHELKGKVKIGEWISHDELPKHLNELKLLVLPSYSEGLPNIMIEAMACGTPVLATPVGGIPDVIKDGETGFVLEDNSPECIAENVIRALNHPNLNEIVENARNLIEEEFTYEAAVEKYRKILERI